MSTSPSASTHEVVPLAERLRYMQLFRFLIAGLVLVAAAVAPDERSVGLGNLLWATAGYLFASLVTEGLWRLRRSRGLTLFGAMLIADGVYLAWTSYVTGGTTSPLRYLILLHLIVVSLLASYRTGLKLALWHSLLALVTYHAQEAGILERFEELGRTASAESYRLYAFMTAFWFVAIVTASFSAVNERELRRRKIDLEGLAAMATALDQATDSHGVAEVVLDSISDNFGFSRAVLLGSVDDGLTLLAARDLNRVTTKAWYPGVDEVISTAWLEKRTVLVKGADPAHDPRLTTMLPDSRNLVIVPLFAEGRAIGALVVEHAMRSGSRIERRVVSALERFASHAALALRNAWLLEQMQELASTDGLTAVANRRTFESTLDKELARAERTGNSVGLVLLDIDHFKMLNDSHGHQIGDDVLRQVAAALSSTSRKFETVARYGGEEFAVLLPGASGDEAVAAAERLRRALSEADTIVPVTASAGVAVYPVHAADGSSLVAAADKALYTSKRRGRNRVSYARVPRTPVVSA